MTRALQPRTKKVDNQVIHIATGFEDSWALPASVMIKSVVHNTRSAVHFHIFSRDLQEATKVKLRRLLNDMSEIEFIKIDERDFEGFHTEGFALETYFRFLIPKHIKDTERVIYLDADLLVRDDISHLVGTDLEGHAVAAALEIWREEKYVVALKGVYKPYFNAGVMIYDMKIINEAAAHQWFNFAREQKSKITDYDQDVLNWFYQDFKILHPKFNVMSPYYMDSKTIEKPRFYKGSEIAEAVRDAKIIHYNMAGCKPWVVRCVHPKTFIYLVYLAKTPWRYILPKLVVGRFIVRLYNLLTIGSWKITSPYVSNQVK